MLEKIKILLDINDTDKQDNKLNIYIDIAADTIKNYLNNNALDNEFIKNNYQAAVIELVCKVYKSKDTNNIKQMTQGSRTITYQDANSGGFNITEDIANLLPTPYIKMM